MISNSAISWLMSYKVERYLGDWKPFLNISNVWFYILNLIPLVRLACCGTGHSFFWQLCYYIALYMHCFLCPRKWVSRCAWDIPKSSCLTVYGAVIRDFHLGSVLYNPARGYITLLDNLPTLTSPTYCEHPLCQALCFVILWVNGHAQFTKHENP